MYRGRSGVLLHPQIDCAHVVSFILPVSFTDIFRTILVMPVLCPLNPMLQICEIRCAYAFSLIAGWRVIFFCGDALCLPTD